MTSLSTLNIYLLLKRLVPNIKNFNGYIYHSSFHLMSSINVGINTRSFKKIINAADVIH